MIPPDARIPKDRVIVLGASNLARGISMLLPIAKRAWGTPLDLMMAMGLGRSYGKESSALGRVLPGIIESGLWEDLQKRPPAKTLLLITDVGNDILYGYPPRQIADWVETCIRRAQTPDSSLVITSLPMETISKVGTVRFKIIATLLYSRINLSLDETLKRARELDGELAALALRYKAHLIKPDPIWYGVDPIHIRVRYWEAAWKKFFSPVSKRDLEGPTQHSLKDFVALQSLKPLYQRIFGFERHSPQPAAVLPEGTMISLY